MKIPKWLIIVFLLVVAVVLIELGGNMGGVYYEDTNGDDNFALQTISDEDILKGKTEADGLSGNVNSSTGEESYLSNSFSGVAMLFSQEGNGEDVEFTIEYLTVEKGNFKMAVVVNEKIVHEFNLNERNQSYTVENSQGDVSLVVAGESAKCDFKFNVD